MAKKKKPMKICNLCHYLLLNVFIIITGISRGFIPEAEVRRITKFEIKRKNT